MAIKVAAKTVEAVEIYRWIPFAFRLDVLPFSILYLIWLAAVAPSLEHTDALIILGSIGFVHVLTILFTAWSVDFRCFAHAKKVKSVHEAEICKVIPAKFSGSKEVVPVSRRNLLPGEKQLLGSSPVSKGDGSEVVRFEFRKQQFLFSEDENVFHKLDFPSKEPVGTYSKWSGYGSDTKAEAALQKWGRNMFDFPQPTFQKLFKEQCIEPFFVFQVFCVGLWCLDEYWYYSLFTLFMLLLFESTMVNSRLRTLKELRRVRVDSQTIMVHRGGKWVKLSGVDLVPGDVVSIGRSTSQGSEERTVPADMLIIAGSAIANEALLTGESTPQWKGPIMGRAAEEKLSVRRDKANVLFGGTKILQHTTDKAAAIKTPDGGCLAVVLRTGFDTSQGKLMRTILFSTERVTANNWESGLFILFLVFFALIAAGYVLMKGLEDPNRSRYKLFLNCSLILTSVIPPELPMELSIAVNTSLIALVRRGIYCTEPFRIPFAGKVDVCCFDKTGTLTSDDMEFRGVVDLDEDKGPQLATDAQKIGTPAVMILASCHALVFVDGKLVGDPLEKAALKGVDWSFTAEEKAVSRRGNQSVHIVQRYQFASHLKRMSVLARVADASGYIALAKGAPETIQEYLADVPSGYTEAYKQYTRQGSRVLALAFKDIPDIPVAEARTLEREAVESNLVFAGFAVFACPLRSDSADVLAELAHSSHDLVMITGDQALTACHVAAQVHILTRPVLILTPVKGREGTAEFVWLSVDEQLQVPYRLEGVEELAEDYDLCVAGEGLSMLDRTQGLTTVIPLVQVFARVAPVQKELILTTLKAAGRVTLMCGDGTNDVGALKQAHCGVALLNAVPPLPPASATPTTPGASSSTPSPATASKRDPTQPGARPRKLRSATAGAALANGGPDPKDAVAAPDVKLTAREMHQRRVREQQDKLKKMMKELEESGDGRAQVVKLGDASMASPFTAKHASVRPTVDIIRQGRSTLVTTLQMFKILGLNCLSTAYVLSVMYLDGVKLGDSQATISGIFTAAFFLFISHAKPMPSLSPQRPHPGIFSVYVVASMLGQFAIHLTFLATVVSGARAFMPQECIEPDSKFHPNLVNTVSYTANMMIQVATFGVNYIGHPFNQSVSENKPFFYALTSAAIFFTLLTSDSIRSLNDYLELVKLPQPFGAKVLLMAGGMMVACYSWENLLRWIFPVKVHSHSKLAAQSRLARKAKITEQEKKEK